MGKNQIKIQRINRTVAGNQPEGKTVGLLSGL